jgi:hypothetical protein
MRTRSKSRATLLILLLGLLASCGVQREGIVLFSAQEAERLRLSEGETPPSLRTRSLSPGPRVVIRQPKVEVISAGNMIRTATPTNLLVVFEEYKAPVDMASLEIKAKKGIFSKSLTPMLKPYIQGTTIQVGDLEIPVGRFSIEIEIADKAGAKTAEIYLLDVTH